MNGQGDAGQNQPRSATGAKLDGMNLGMRVLSYLISGVGFYGFLGWLGDHFLGTSFLLPIGIVAGAGVGGYASFPPFCGVGEGGPHPGDGPVVTETAAHSYDEGRGAGRTRARGRS